ncbi:hypothetical protein D3C73_902450 [compost metagenome]
MVQVKAIFKGAIGAKHEVADHPVATLDAGALDAGQHRTVVVGQLCADDRRRAQQAHRQFLGQFGVDVIGNT